MIASLHKALFPALWPVVMLLFMVAEHVQATSFAPPKDHTIKSENGRFQVVVGAGNGAHQIKQTGLFKKVLWSFHRAVAFDDFFVSDDGQSVVCVGWKFVKSDELDRPAISFYKANGTEHHLTISHMGSVRRIRRNEIGPIGSFWRIWREECNFSKGVVTVVLSGGATVRADLKTAKVTMLR